MPVVVDRDKCKGCGRCEEQCPGDVIRLDEQKVPRNAYPEGCWYCGACEIECPHGAARMQFPYLIL